MRKSTLEKRPHLIPAIIASMMLFLTLAPWPYGYYQLLRFVICGVAGYIAFMAYNWKKIWAVWLFIFVAVLFNPLIPIHLSHKVWQPIDIVCGILFIIVVFVLEKSAEEKQKGKEQ